ncbi:MAG: nitronate monooxygenase [Halieaceae bacterium]|jgi:NAD(P)H-dependent flavin oxidoreductase YrpB (nitropropane dioxygenase family)|nr:nitronate monooxygenase [Halieaceae bacterium]
MNPLSELPICQKLDIKYPIFGFSHSVEVTAAICKAGGVGIYGATRDMPERIVSQLAKIRELVGDRPFGVDLLLPKGMQEDADFAAVEAMLPQEQKDFVAYLADKYKVPPATEDNFFSSQIRTNALFDGQIDAVMESSVDLFATGIGGRKDAVERAKKLGKMTVALVGAPKHVLAAKDWGIDLIVAQGHEAGGHTGKITTLALVPQVVDIAGDIPVLAAGGIGDGRQVAASLALGAQGAWLGTLWLAAREHKTGAVLMKQILEAGSADTVVSRAHSGKPARLIKSTWTEEWASPEAPEPLPMPLHQVVTGPLLAAVEEHQVEALIYGGAGQSVAWCQEETTVDAIMQRLITETGAVLTALPR